MWPSLVLVTFTEGVLNGKLHFLYSVIGSFKVSTCKSTTFFKENYESPKSDYLRDSNKCTKLCKGSSSRGLVKFNQVI